MEIIVIKGILQNNPCLLVDRILSLECKLLLENKTSFGSERYPVVLMLPYVGTESSVFKRDIRLITEKAFYSSVTTVIFKSNPMLPPKGKDQISIEDNSCVVYTFDGCCENSYIGQINKNFRARIKEHILKCVENYIKTSSETTNCAIKNIIYCRKFDKLY